MQRTVLVAGASGLVGTAAARAFRAAGWRVIALSRREPELLDGLGCEHVALDLTDAAACRAAATRFADVTHVVYAAVYELPGLVAGWVDPQQIEPNGAMLRHLLDQLLDQGRLEHITLLQGTKAYGGHVQALRIPARERQPRVEHPNFYWLQEDTVRAAAAEHGLRFTILRPQLIVGPNHGVVMNPLPVIGAYAALRSAEGAPFSYPGGPDWVWEMVDASLVGRAALWAADAPAAAGETFNITNGEVFCWRDLWPAMADTLGVRIGPEAPCALAEWLPARASLWDQVVATRGLKPITLPDLLGESHHYTDLCLTSGARSAPAPMFVSTVKLRQAGFTEVV
ncbi:MAG: NAD-dependent epimerase/dehydratase family protein, partial [Pseudomonadales bacterium]